ncbi:hypothetical protein Dimus_002251 [Dionaea muscipula]
MTMADDPCFSCCKHIFIPKTSPPLSRIMIALVLAVVCGVYIFSIFLKQVSFGSGSTAAAFLNIQVSDSDSEINAPCPTPHVDPSEFPYVHYPKPHKYSRAECACNPVRYFAILSTQRSGSGWFETLLNSHTNISSNGEIFSVKVRRRNISTIMENLDNLYNLDWLSSASKNECTAAVGLKWMLNQGLMQNHKEIVKYFNRKGVSLIFLFRRNLLRRMISILANSFDRDAKPLNGTHKSHVHSPYEAEILARYKPLINASSLIRQLREVAEMTTKGLEYFKSTRHILLYYEDIVTNRSKLIDVEDFLRVPRMNLTSRQVKIHRGPLSEQVGNWDEVQKTLNGTEFHKFLDSDYLV